jgi:uncharacterized protein
MFTTLTDSTKAVVFYALAFGMTLAISLLSPLLLPLLGDWFMLLHMYSPTIALVLMLLVVTRDGYTRTAWRELGIHRAGLRSWPLALLGPLAIFSAVYALVWLGGLGHAVLPDGATPASLLPDLAAGLLMACAFALGEELGFRGYLLRRLLPLGTGRALVVSGLLHAIWHFPVLLLTPLLPITGSWWIAGPIFLVVLTAAGVFYGLLQLSSGSVWPATLAHGAVNTYLNVFKALTVTAAPVALSYLAGETGVLTATATALAAWLVYQRVQQRRGARSLPLPAGT